LHLIWRCDYLSFQISEKMGEFAASIVCSKAKTVSASGGFTPWPPDHGLCPWTSLGAPPPDPRYRLALCALAMPPLCQILNTPLMTHSSVFERQLLVQKWTCSVGRRRPGVSLLTYRWVQALGMLHWRQRHRRRDHRPCPTDRCNTLRVDPPWLMTTNCCCLIPAATTSSLHTTHTSYCYYCPR